MRQTVEMYIGFFMLLLIMILAMAFTTINIHVSHARTLYNSVKAQVQASNGAMVDSSNEFTADFVKNGCTFRDDGFEVAYIVKRVSNSSDSAEQYNQTWIYNDIYRVDLFYVYNVPFFGRQVYPISGYVY